MSTTNHFHLTHRRTITILLSLCMLTSCLAAPGRPERAPQTLARSMHVDHGLCAFLGGDRDMLAQLVVSTNLLIHVQDPDAERVTELRKLADSVNIGIDRIIIEEGPLDKLPYADNIVDMLVAGKAVDDPVAMLSLTEIMRVLRPEGTAVIIAPSATSRKKLEDWAGAAAIRDVQINDGGPGVVMILTKPAPEGVDDWPLWEHGPDNNPVSTDNLIKAPYLTQFLEHPQYITMPAITTAAGGRTFLATGHIAHHPREWDMINLLIARNGYNGIELWRRKLPEGFLAHSSAFFATRDIFYLMDGDGCLMLDSKTGREKGKIRIPGLDGHWKWMVIDQGILYVLVGDERGQAKIIKGDRNFGGWSWADLSVGYYEKPRVPWGFGRTLAAYRLEDEKLIFKHTEDSPIDSRALAMRDGKLFLYCPEKHLRCINIHTGKPIWTNGDSDVLGLIEQPGRGLVSTPGFRSCCIAVASPDALIIQGQTRMNVIAVATKDGKLLWQKKKITNNPNVIFIDERAVLGVGPGSMHVAVDPVTGEVLENLKFRKAACTRLTATPDSLFVRGEGLLRFDRESKRVLVDGGARPACNDGALPANGMLYVGPWQCDCSLSLIGAMGKCSAGDFKFDYLATEADNFQRLSTGKIEALRIAPDDWPTYRANNKRSASTPATLARPNASADARPVPSWTYTPDGPHVPTTPVAAGGLVFSAGSDGKVRAINANTGQLRWTFSTCGPIKMAPTIAKSRAYIGSGDGYVYALEAASGRLIWRFRAAPRDRKIMVYGNLCSTWPVNTGILVEDDTAYFAAGIIDSDGTYVYALDAESGEIKWQNNSSGHLVKDLRKGVSAQGNLTIRGPELLMAGGNQVSPARFTLNTGQCLNQPFQQGNPKANHGKFAGLLLDKFPVVGGRILYSSPENVANKDSFVVNNGRQSLPLNFGGIPPAWNDEVIVVVNFRDGKLTCLDAKKAAQQIEKGLPQGKRRPAWSALADSLRSEDGVLWATNLDQKQFEVVSLAVTPACVVATVKYQNRNRAHPEWFLIAFNSRNGTPLNFWRHPLGGTPLPGGLMVGRRGQVVVTMLDGTIRSFAPLRPRRPQQSDRRPGT